MSRSVQINTFPPPPLNKSHSTFDRELLIPQSASASQLGEARNALARAHHRLKDHNFTSDKMAA